MSVKKIRVGVIGAGRWAYASHFPSLSTLKGVELSGISSLHHDSAMKAAKQFDIPHVFKSWKALVFHKEIDAVIILSPPKTHYPIAMAALEQRKHVLCEAPVAMNARDAGEMLKVAESNGLTHGYIRPKLYIDGGQTVKKLLANEKIGTVQDILINWRPKVWLDKKIPLCWRHLLSQSPPLLSVVPMIILIDLFGPVKSVSAHYGIHIKKRYSEEHRRMMKSTAPDFFHGLMQLKNGINVTIQAGAGYTPFPESGFHIFGTKGTLVWDWSLPNKIMIGRPGKPTMVPISYPFSFQKKWTFDEDFIQAIRKKSLPLYNFKQGVDELKVVDAITVSAKEKRWVTVKK